MKARGKTEALFLYYQNPQIDCCPHWGTHMAVVLTDLTKKNAEPYVVEFRPTHQQYIRNKKGILKKYKNADYPERGGRKSLISDVPLDDFIKEFEKLFPHHKYDLFGYNCATAGKFTFNFLFPRQKATVCLSMLKCISCPLTLLTCGCCNIFPLPPGTCDSPPDLWKIISMYSYCNPSSEANSPSLSLFQSLDTKDVKGPAYQAMADHVEEKKDVERQSLLPSSRVSSQ